jgi:RNA polymerase sigma factor (sigma-70 family)
MTDWNSIVRDHTPLVWGTAWRLLGNQADAADCFQETFLAALEASRREPVRHWPALLARIATTRAVDRLRRRLRRSEANGDEVGWETFPAPQAGPAKTAEDHELGARLRRILAELSEPQGTVFSLRFLSEWSNEEIARELGMTANAVAVMIHRTRGHLKERLASLVARPEEVEP